MTARATEKRDVTLRCHECGEDFIWTANDQEFYEEKGFEPPKRCRPCRQKRKNERHAS